MKRYIATVMLIIFMATLNAYSVLEQIDGNYLGNLDGRSAAMGSAQTGKGYNLFSSLTNPGNLSFLRSKFGAQVTGNFIFNQENRALPMYNSFDAYADDATYVSNSNLFDNFAAGVFGRYAVADHSVSASIFYHPYIDFNVDYLEEVRNNQNSDYNNYPPIIAKNYIESAGSIDAISFITAYSYANWLNFGLNVSKLSGDANWERKINWSDYSLDEIPSLQNSYNYLDREFEGWLIQLGGNVRVNERTHFGFSLNPKVELDVTGMIDSTDIADVTYLYTEYYPVYDSTGALTGYTYVDSLTFADYTIPMRLRAGVNYAPRNIMRTNFAIDLEYVTWSDANPLYDDAFNYYLGVEHKLKNSIPLRLGFNYLTKYCIKTHDGNHFADKVMMPTFSAGTGFMILEKFQIDISLEYANRQYEALDLFPDTYYDYPSLWENYQYLNFEDRGWENPDTVKESFVKLKTSIEYKW